MYVEPHSLYGMNDEMMDSQIMLYYALQATAICELDLTLGRRQAEHDGRDHPTSSHRVLGSNFVGIVHHSSPSAENSGFKPGTRVASITDGGSNARYVNIAAEKLIKVPKHLDAADVACLISAYLPAFQALHHGGPRSRRYKKDSLLGKKILIVQGASPEAQALVRLARLAGASEIYLTASKDHFWQLDKHGCILLGDDPDDWLPEVNKGMDLVVNYEFPKYFSETKSALAPKGRLVCCVPMHTHGDDSWLTYFESMMGYLQLVTMKRASVFDFAENHELQQDRVREDLSYLLKLLTARQVRPEIDRYIKLSDVPKTYRHMRKQRRKGNMAFTGTIICEPWRE
jgi:NADPH:quinone reductase-like Zn-dependent oxidoreductase